MFTTHSRVPLSGLANPDVRKTVPVESNVARTNVDTSFRNGQRKP